MISLFTWNESFLTHLPSVDEQHQRLVGLINDIGELVMSSDVIDRQAFATVRGNLLDYVRVHFGDEESRMKQVGIDPRHIDMHSAEHRSFIGEVAVLADGSAPISLEHGRRLVNYLVNWLAYHILNIDQSMARQTLAIKNGLSPAQAFEKDDQYIQSNSEPLLMALKGLFLTVSERNRELRQSNQELEQQVKLRSNELAHSKYLEKSLRESELLFRESQRVANIGSFKADFKSGLWESSEVFNRILGIDDEHANNLQLVLDLVHPDDLQSMKKILAEQASPAQRSFTRQYRTVRKSDGLMRWLAGTCEFDFDPEGQINYLIGTIQDVTDHKRQESIQKARLHLMQLATDCTLQDLMVATTDEAESITGSSIGFYHFVEDNQRDLTLQAWSTQTLARYCKRPGHSHQPVDEAGIWADCIRLREPVMHNDYTSVPHKRGLPENHAHLERELIVPVIRNGRVVAVLGVGNKPTPYMEDDLLIVSQLADLSWDMVETKRFQELLLQRKQQLQELYISQQTVREEERRRIARELHDDLGSMATALRIEVSSLRGELAAMSLPASPQLAGITLQLDQMVDSIRRISEDLRPGILDTLGMIPAVEVYVKKFAGRTGIDCDLTMNREEFDVREEVAIGIFRILQEALNNVAKHSTASRIWISLLCTPEEITLIVEDNGAIPHDVRPEEAKGFGLRGMQERVAMLNGHISIQIRQGQGVCIEAVIPT